MKIMRFCAETASFQCVWVEIPVPFFALPVCLQVQELVFDFLIGGLNALSNQKYFFAFFHF